MKFYTNSSNKRIHIICKQANDLLNNVDFQMKLRSIHGFKQQYTSPEVSGSYVLARLMSDPSQIEVKEFRSKIPWSKSNGYTKNDGRLVIFLNNRKFDRSDASIVATVMHESVHEADNNDEKYFYNHGDNTPKGGTAPEVVADIAYLVLSGLPSSQDSSL